MIFAEGEQEQVIRAAIAYKDAGLGEPILIGRDEIVLENMKSIGLGDRDDLKIANTSNSERVDDYAAYLYERLQRRWLPRKRCDAHG
jgi:malate dehydrogenase (oxaloacetate-decarboxylating)(NADP+)